MKKILHSRAFKIAAEIFVIALAAVLVMKFVTISDGKKSDTKEKNTDGKSLTATLEIEFTIVYNEENYANLRESLKKDGMLPESGYFAKDETLSFTDGDTVYSLLTAYCADNGIDLDCESPSENAYGTAYIKGIGGLYESDCTKNSGWVYSVDGESPDIGISDYVLSDGDSISVSFVVF
jgi:hypothetical protein